MEGNNALGDAIHGELTHELLSTSRRVHGIVERGSEEASHDDGDEDAEGKHTLISEKPGHILLVDLGDSESTSEFNDNDIAARRRSAAR